MLYACSTYMYIYYIHALLQRYVQQFRLCYDTDDTAVFKHMLMNGQQIIIKDYTKPGQKTMWLEGLII